NVERVYCDDNGTPSNPTDDVYYAEVLVTGANTSVQGFTIGNVNGQYGTPVTVGPFPIAAGNVSLQVKDREDSNCTTAVDITAPAETCSDQCELFVEVQNIQCDDNGTPSIADDDQ